MEENNLDNKETTPQVNLNDNVQSQQVNTEENNNIQNMEVETENQPNQSDIETIQQPDQNTEQNVPEKVPESKKSKWNKREKKLMTTIIILLLIIIAGITVFTLNNDTKKNENNNEINKNENNDESENKEENPEVQKSPYQISSNALEPFDLYFLQVENEKQNKVYSPLSIKYALGMLEEGAEGESKAQISSVMGNYKAKTYTNNQNMSFANAMFIKDTYQNTVNEKYKNTLQQKYKAEINYDSFATPNNVNSWVSDKTLGLINNLFDDISKNQFLLINTLAIDMDWEEKFIKNPGIGIHTYYRHENFSWRAASKVIANQFHEMQNEISGMDIVASFNNYDIVNVLGKDYIKKIVKNAFEKYLMEHPNESISQYFYGEDTTGLTDDELMEKYLNRYIEEIDTNYKRKDITTDFSFYVDDNVKVFAKDLKEYNGTTLQYVGIMPTNEDLNSYINNVTVNDLNNMMNSLKELKLENFKDGVVTKITGFIPKFKFEYNLNLKEDLKQLGITNVFELEKANLKNISSDLTLYINDATQKANIEFTQDGIKAAAVTYLGAGGISGGFKYSFDVPVEEIDLTFDKPYMFLIRDKKTKEVWFAGTVYNPLLYSEDTTKYTGP